MKERFIVIRYLPDYSLSDKSAIYEYFTSEYEAKQVASE